MKSNTNVQFCSTRLIKLKESLLWPISSKNGADSLAKYVGETKVSYFFKIKDDGFVILVWR